MLTHLTVRDFAIVERLELELGPGMTVLTGETGAGKSILIDALGLALGQRASARVVRSGVEQAEVIAVFDLDARDDAARYLAEHALASTDGECILRRTITADGRSRAYVNAIPVPLQTLRGLGDLLVDIHGQHEHQSLLKSTAQRRILDEHAGHEEAIEKLAGIVDNWQDARRAIEALAGGPEEREQRLDYLRYQLRELDTLDIQSNELDSLDEEHRRLSHANELLERCDASIETIDGDGDASLRTRLAEVSQVVAEMAAIDAALGNASELLASAGIQLDESVAELRRYQDGIELDPERLRAVDMRLSAIYDAARKHRVDAHALPELRERLRGEVGDLEGSGARLAELEASLENSRAAYASASRTLHDSRLRAGAELAKTITANMQSLGMPRGYLEIAVSADFEAPPSREGADTVTFQVAINPGQAPQPLAKVASGGELSRISLAIQVVATRSSGAPTLIFDEVDAGIGGRVAEIVGRELRRLANNRQVLCVTHLPQVASLAQQHVQVQKHSKRRQTHTDLRALSGESRVEEIARMLGGVDITDQALAHARQMLEQN